MADQFIGRQVRVSLRDSSKLVGKVINVINGSLFLNDVTFVDTGQQSPALSLPGNEIVDLDLIPIHHHDKKEPQSDTATGPIIPQSNLFVDPAIVSAGSTLSSEPAPDSSHVPAMYVALPGIPIPSNNSQGPPPGDESSSESSVDPDPYTYHNPKAPVKPAKSTKSRIERPAPRSKSKKLTASRNNKPQPGFDSDGWATEDVTDFKDTEFDFQANLDRFDKKQVFQEIKQHDTTLPGARLVDFNRVGGPNHDANLTQGGSGSGRNSVNNGVNSAPDPPIGLAGKYGHREMIIARQSDLWESSDEEESPGLTGASVSHIASRKASRPLAIAELPSTIHFVIQGTGTTCPCASPVQMVELERTASQTYGISESILNENAGRGVAQVIINALGGHSRFDAANHNARPLVVAFAGNNRAGARALAACRHLANRQVRIVAVVLGLERNTNSEDQYPPLKAQVTALEAAKGKVVSRIEQLTAALSTLDAPPDLLIDGIQGYQVAFDDLWEDDITIVLSLIDWANRQKANVLSLDIPAGLDSSTGNPSSLRSYIKAKWVLSCGLPLTGTLNAHITGLVEQREWIHYVLDVGFPRGALQKGSMRRFGQIWFGADWLVGLQVVD